MKNLKYTISYIGKILPLQQSPPARVWLQFQSEVGRIRNDNS